MWSYPLASPAEDPTCPGPRSESPGLWSKRILVVDDEVAIRDLLVRTLSGKGYVVDIAADGEEALRAVQRKNYDGLITDLKMPRLGGQGLYENLELMDRGLARRVVFMTGDTASPESRAFIAATGNSLIEKPFDLAEVLRQLRNALEAELPGARDG